MSFNGNSRQANRSERNHSSGNNHHVQTSSTGGPVPQQQQQINMQLASHLLNAISSGLNNPSATQQQATGQHMLQQLVGMQLPLQQPQQPQSSSLMGAAVAAATKNLQQQQQQQQHHSKKKHKSASGTGGGNHSNDKDKPAFSVVPCRARGMPAEHNSNSAYFSIPRDVKHGENLSCSFAACRNEGIKFCYCAICGIPVAKRNFRQRHDHSDKEPRQEGTAGKKRAIDSLQIPKRRRRKHSKVVVNNNNSNNITRQDNNLREEDVPMIQNGSVPPQDDSDPADPARGRRVEAPMKNLVIHQRRSSNSATSPAEQERQRKWAALLRERPRDTEGDEMSKWLLAILSVSNAKAGGRDERCGDEESSSPSEARTDDSSSSVVDSNNDVDISSSERSSGEAGWNSSSEARGSSGDSSDPNDSSSGNNDGTSGSSHDGQQELSQQAHDQHNHVPPLPRAQSSVPVVSDFRNSTESPSGSTDNGGVDTTTSGTNCDPSGGSGSGSNDSTIPREASSSMSGSINSSEASAGQPKQNQEAALRTAQQELADYQSTKEDS